MIVIDCGHCKALLEAKTTTTVAELYNLIVDELDDEMIPGAGIPEGENDNPNECSEGFSFLIWIQNIQPTKKQSQRITVSDIIKNKWTVRLVDKRVLSSRKSMLTTTNMTINGNGKRLREQSAKIEEHHNSASEEEQTYISMQTQVPKHVEKVPALTPNQSSTTTTLASSSSSIKYVTSVSVSLNKSECPDSDPSPIKRPRIFSNSDTTGIENEKRQSDKPLSLVVTPYDHRKQFIPPTDELEEQQKISKVEHHCDQIGKTTTEKLNDGTSFATTGRSNHENGEMQQLRGINLTHAKRRSKAYSILARIFLHCCCNKAWSF